ncbi:MAG: hypothetical protein QOI73_1622 [Solirubrobacteraceae bacterium]|jgi:hypothetical protein|nr:hypothetical protein [Solirubrobacteraceae bacterium]
MLDLLRGIFPYAVAVLLPLAGAILAIVKFVEGDGREGIRLAAATLLGCCLYALLLT